MTSIDELFEKHKDKLQENLDTINASSDTIKQFEEKLNSYCVIKRHKYLIDDADIKDQLGLDDGEELYLEWTVMGTGRKYRLCLSYEINHDDGDETICRPLIETKLLVRKLCLKHIDGFLASLLAD